jgi:hypothetical protein
MLADLAAFDDGISSAREEQPDSSAQRGPAAPPEAEPEGQQK